MDYHKEQELVKERQERLKELFRSEIWQDLKVEIQRCLDNATDTALSPTLGNDREVYIGKVSGIKEILNLERKFQ